MQTTRDRPTKCSTSKANVSPQMRVLAETWAGDVEGTAFMARGSPGLIEWAGIARVERKRIWWRVNGSRNAIASLTVNLAVSPRWCMLNLSVVIKIDGYVSAGIEKTLQSATVFIFMSPYRSFT